MQELKKKRRKRPKNELDRGVFATNASNPLSRIWKNSGVSPHIFMETLDSILRNMRAEQPFTREKSTFQSILDV